MLDRVTGSERRHIVSVCIQLQDLIINGLGRFEKDTAFQKTPWDRPDINAIYGGGGVSGLLRGGEVFEQAGVSVSAVEGTLPAEMTARLGGNAEKAPFFAAGISLVIHPRSPHIPTTHANVRYLEVGDESWVGGGLDLTPYLLYEEDATHFHQTLKQVCEAYPVGDYPQWKTQCDEYFHLPHREEARGVGGIFFDYLGRGDKKGGAAHFGLIEGIGKSFLPAYLPIVERRQDSPVTEEEKSFQLLRRGRYIEFNLLYDRGTLFGLKTKGRTSSIFMSFPPEARWNPEEPEPPTERARRLLQVVRTPRDWV